MSEIEFIEGSLAGKRWLDCRKRWIDSVSRLAGLGGQLIHEGAQSERSGLDERWKLTEDLAGRIREGEQLSNWGFLKSIVEGEYIAVGVGCIAVLVESGCCYGAIGPYGHFHQSKTL